MKICPNCTASLLDEAVQCPYCSTMLNNSVILTTNKGKEIHYSDNNKRVSNSSETLRKVFDIFALIFMILSCICFSMLIIPLFWMIPMTIHASQVIKKENEKFTFAYSICVLLFVNVLSGILLIVRDEI